MDLSFGLASSSLGAVGAQCYAGGGDLTYAKSYCDALGVGATLPITLAYEKRALTTKKEKEDEDRARKKSFDSPYSSSYLHRDLHFSPSHRYLSLLQAGGYAFSSSGVSLSRMDWVSSELPWAQRLNPHLLQAEAAMKDAMRARAAQILAREEKKKRGAKAGGGSRDKDESFVPTTERQTDIFRLQFDQRLLDWYRPEFSRASSLLMSIEGVAWRKPEWKKHMDTTEWPGREMGTGRKLATATSWILAIVAKSAGDVRTKQRGSNAH